MDIRGLQFLLKIPRDLQDLHSNSQQPSVLMHHITYVKTIRPGKMMFLTITFCFFIYVYDSLPVDIMPELKRNILNFRYGVNFKYEGTLSQSFNRFYAITKYELPKVSDLKLTVIEFDLNCSYLNGEGKYMTKLRRHFLRIVPYVSFYQRQITYYNLTIHRILMKDIGLILPNIPTRKRNW